MMHGVIAFGVLSGPLPRIGVIVVALLAGGVLLASARRIRALAMFGALVLATALLLASLWHDSKLRVIHEHPLDAAAASLVAIAVGIALAAWLSRHPRGFAPLAVLALPFRVPITTGGTTSNLLVPLYAVVAVGGLAYIGGAWRRSRSPYRSRREETAARDVPPAPRPAPDPRLLTWMERLLALALVLYAIQSLYSADFQTALQNMVFFYVPFALLYRLLREVHWSRETLRGCLLVAVGLGLVFSAIGFAEYATRSIFLNSKLVYSNDLHAYFTVNSVFDDPDIFGRYLALTMLLLSAGLLYRRAGRELWGTIAALAVMWLCLCLTLSRSSLAALLVGLAVLAALRWKPSRALVVAVVVIAIGAITIAATPRTFGLNQGVNGVASGRGGLVSGGISLFSQRPLYGYGSGSFVTQYRRHHRNVDTTLSASHTIPITVAAEQGLIGLIVYLALVSSALGLLVRGARGDPVRSAIAATFAALLFHTLLYADFLEDPTTWALLGVGAALAAATTPAARPGRSRRPRAARIVAAEASDAPSTGGPGI
jgi:putative inorganic carbon (HCO3(-)) transporter